MKILNYKYEDGPAGGWDYSRIELGKINLIVGETGSGKTKLLNTIFNLGTMISQGSIAKRGNWNLEFTADKKKYIWEYSNPYGDRIESEKLTLIEESISKVVIDRSKETFTYNDNKLPKLSPQTSAISLLKEEELIAPVHAGFGKIARRSFFSDEMERAAALSNLPINLNEKFQENQLGMLHDYPLSVRLYYLRGNHKEKYTQICDYFKSIFPTIEAFDIPNASTLNIKINIELASGKIPVFAIKEKNVEQLIGLPEFSSGMQKVLLLLTDIMTLPGDWIYLIDEYENSLGVNAINFLPDFLSQHGNNNQFIITTHHPYLINNMPIKNWFVFTRHGSKVDITYGEKLEEKFGKSNQKAFVQLMNDPIYTGG